MQGHVRSVGAWSRPHRLLDQLFRIAVQLLAAKQSKNDALLVDDDSGVPALGCRPRLHVTEPVGQRASRDVLARDISGTGTLRVRAFGGQAGSHPVDLAIDVVRDIAKPQ